MKKLLASLILLGNFIFTDAQTIKDGVYLYLKSGETLNEKHLEVLCVISIENGQLYSKFETPKQAKEKLKRNPYCYDAYRYISYDHGINLARGINIDREKTTSKRIVYTYLRQYNKPYPSSENYGTSLHDMHFAISPNGSSLIYWTNNNVEKRSLWHRIQPKDLIPQNNRMDFLNR